MGRTTGRATRPLLGHQRVVGGVQGKRYDRGLGVGSETSHYTWGESSADPLVSPRSTKVRSGGGRQDRTNVGSSRSRGRCGKKGGRRKHVWIERLLIRQIPSTPMPSATTSLGQKRRGPGLRQDRANRIGSGIRRWSREDASRRKDAGIKHLLVGQIPTSFSIGSSGLRHVL